MCEINTVHSCQNVLATGDFAVHSPLFFNYLLLHWDTTALPPPPHPSKQGELPLLLNTSLMLPTSTTKQSILTELTVQWVHTTAHVAETSLVESRFLHGKRKLVQEIGRFKKSKVKLQRSLSKGNENWFKKRGGGGGFEKSRVQEIGIPLYQQHLAATKTTLFWYMASVNFDPVTCLMNVVQMNFVQHVVGTRICLH